MSKKNYNLRIEPELARKLIKLGGGKGGVSKGVVALLTMLEGPALSKEFAKCLQNWEILRDVFQEVDLEFERLTRAQFRETAEIIRDNREQGDNSLVVLSSDMTLEEILGVKEDELTLSSINGEDFPDEHTEELE